MEWGDQLDKIPDDSRIFTNRPQLLPGLDFFFQAFTELQTERQIGMAAGPIPWYSIIKWAEFHGLKDPDDIDVLMRHIRSMETVQREHEAKDDN